MRLRLEKYVSADFPFAAFPVRGNADFPLHSHDFTELVVVLEGSATHLAAGEEYRMSAGDVFVIPRGMAHGYSGSRGVRMVNILFDLERLGLPIFDLRGLPGFHALFELEPGFRKRHRFESRLRLAEPDLAATRSLADRMLSELGGKKPGFKAACAGLLMELLVFVSRCQGKSPPPERAAVCALARTTSFMENNPGARVTLGRLARMANMSRRNFQRAFKEATGISPIACLLKIRVDRAKRLLSESPGASMSEVARAAGFADSNYFSRQFKRIAGVAPREYRSRLA